LKNNLLFFNGQALPAGMIFLLNFFDDKR